MPRKAVDVTDTELAILELLWERAPETIRGIASELYGEWTTAQYATVQSLLERLEAKGCVKRDRRSFAHIFTAKIARADLIGQRLQDLAEKLCGGSWTPLLVQLVQRTRLSARDREMLRKLIEQSKK